VIIFGDEWNIVTVWCRVSHGSVVLMTVAERVAGGVVSSEVRSRSTKIGYQPSFTA
jgi:hypothetical protein